MYKLVKNIITNEENIVTRTLENGLTESCLITDQQYLKWLEEGNEPLPAEE